MPTILVVDDCAADRSLVGGLLARGGDYQVACASDGVEALELIARAPPDLVVTDLVMPGMDGFALVSAVRERFPLVPVILMTSRGSEEVAVQALERGAASYVPKRLLAEALLDTVRSVLAVAHYERSQWRLMDCMTRSHSSFVLENDATLFYPLVSYLQECVSQLRLCDATERTRLGVALEEALTNALFHGNLEICSALRESDEEEYYRLVEQRRRQPPYQQRRIFVEAYLSRQEAVFVVRDQGAGFDPACLPDPTQPANLERVSGRGILLMRTFMDEVAYNATGNEVTLIKRRKDGQPSSGR